MNSEAPLSLPQALAGALRRLTQFAHASSWDQWAVQGLSPTHRKILTLLGSRGECVSLATVARELGVTTSTASDSVGTLVRKKLVCKRRSSTDGRTLTLALTERGQESARQLAELPDPLWRAFDRLSPKEQEALYRLSIKMIRALEDNGELPTSRTCVRCRFFVPLPFESAQASHSCSAQIPLGAGLVRIDCGMFEAAGAARQAVLWEGFAGQESEETESGPTRLAVAEG